MYVTKLQKANTYTILKELVHTFVRQEDDNSQIYIFKSIVQISNI